ncbi:MAG: Lrp/AsnC family transcriptional regulator [Candidatus Eremiobacteraeota bacterium]|nr:Lrp/AsnC family transcriptional regulator [Candidatus Eremiobacteraeota bacterium]
MPPEHSTVPGNVSDPVNQAILTVSEDRLAGFQEDPFDAIAHQSGVPVDTVIERIAAMLRSGAIRRIRQTMMSTNLAKGSLVAWQVPHDRLDAAFDYMFQDDPFSGHVVIRTTDSQTPGSNYRLWTTLKVPQGYSIGKHAALLARKVGAERFRLMPAKIVFALGVGHVRRKGIEPGARADVMAEPKNTAIVELSDLEWNILTSLKREFEPEELRRDLWSARASEAGVTLDEFFRVAHNLNARRVIGRFSTFLEHVKPVNNERVTRYNALFHWAVPLGREMDAGREIGRHFIITHAYWREGGPEFKGVNIMAVAHGMEKPMVLAHKAAIDGHLREAGIDFGYTNVFWGGRSEIKPSEISPMAYRDFCTRHGVDPVTMLAEHEDEGEKL